MFQFYAILNIHYIMLINIAVCLLWCNKMMYKTFLIDIWRGKLLMDLWKCLNGASRLDGIISKQVKHSLRCKVNGAIKNCFLFFLWWNFIQTRRMFKRKVSKSSCCDWFSLKIIIHWVKCFFLLIFFFYFFFLLFYYETSHLLLTLVICNSSEL